MKKIRKMFIVADLVSLRQHFKAAFSINANQDYNQGKFFYIHTVKYKA